MKRLILAVALAALAACAAPGGTKQPMTVHQRIETACVSAGTAYEVIAAVNNVHPLKKAQQDQVLKAVAITDQRCKLAPGADYPYTMSEVLLNELEGAAATLNTIKGAVQ